MADESSRRLPVVNVPAPPSEPPIFGRVAIVGLGLIGGSLALAARARWPASIVIGVDANDVLETAMRLHAVDVAADDLVVAAEAELIVLAAPVDQNLEVLAAIPDHVPGPALVTDVGGTKRAMVDAASRLPDRFTFVGGHPLAGAARQGIAYARPDLFANRPWLFTPAGVGAHPDLNRLMRFVHGIGAEPVTLGVEEHDRLLAYLSHLPQIAASVLMALVGQEAGDDGIGLAGRGLVDTTRLASSPSSVWTGICRTNRDHLTAAIDGFIDELRRLRDDLDSGVAVDNLFERANRWRASLESRHATRSE